MIKKLLKSILRIIFQHPLTYLLKKNKILIIFRRGSALGDHIYMSSIIRKIDEKGKYKIILFSNHYEFYLNNPRIYRLIKIKQKNLVWSFLNLLKSEMILEFVSTYNIHNNKHFLFQHPKKNIHLAQSMSNHFNLDLDYKNLQNEIFFSQNEVEQYEKRINLPNKFALIHSSAKSTYTKNKEWSLEGIQDIVNYFDTKNWIQLGTSEEPKLQNCKIYFDLHLRKVAYIVSKCEFIVCYEGFFNHLASCFNKKTFLIHTGFLPIESFKYKNNIIIENNKNLSCYPCYDLICENHKKRVLENLRTEFVLQKIKKNLENSL